MAGRNFMALGGLLGVDAALGEVVDRTDQHGGSSVNEVVRFGFGA